MNKDKPSRRFNTVPATKLRIAVVQLETHPSITVEARDFLSEPFVRSPKPMLLADVLQSKRILGINRLQDDFRKRYLHWAEARLRAVFEYFAMMADEDKPNIIVFPEFGVPCEHLRIIYEELRHVRNKKRGIVIVAGTHAFQGSIKDYDKIFGAAQKINFIKDKHTHSEAARSVLTVVSKSPNSSSIQVNARFKQKLSPFEFTSGHIETSNSLKQKDADNWVWEFKIDAGPEVPLHLFVCAEALQAVNIAAHAQIAIVCAYHTAPKDFDRLINPAIKSGKIAILSSDGRYGGSRFAVLPDSRSHSWWADDEGYRPLPTGDGILLFEVPRNRVAAPLGTATPIKLERLIAIASITSSNRHDEQYIASLDIKAIFEDFDFSLKSQRDAARQMESLARRYTLSSIQKEKISHLISICKHGQMTVSLIKNMTRDCHYGSELDAVLQAKSRSKSHVIESEQNLSLRALEKIFAEETHTWLRHKQDGHDLSPIQKAACSEAQRACIEVFRPGVEIGPIPSIKRLLVRLKAEAGRRASENLNQYLGAMVERFAAGSGWLYIVTSDKESNNKFYLQELISHNAPILREKLRYPIPDKEEEKCGLTSLAFLRRAGVMSNDVNHDDLSKYFIRELPSTQSELAVPIFDSSGSKVKAIINLESDQHNAFLSCHIGELQAAASKLLPDLIIIEHLQSRKAVGGWHPEVHGWGLSRILGEFCNSVACSPSETEEVQALSCTIWHTDWEKACLYVRGSARFNFEYSNNKLLPLQIETVSASSHHRAGRIPTVPSNSWIHGEYSYTASSALNDHGTVSSGSISDMPAFHRPVKAERMGITYIRATPVYDPSKRDETSRSIGVLNLYFFKRQHPEFEFSVFGTFADDVVVWLGDIAGSLISEFKTLRESVSLAKLKSSIDEEGIPYVNLSNILKDVVTQCLETEGCSIFVGRSAKSHPSFTTELNVLHTTGLDISSNRLADNENQNPTCLFKEIDDSFILPKYNVTTSIDDDGQWLKVKGITGFATRYQNCIIRKLDVPDIWEIGNLSGTKINHQDNIHGFQHKHACVLFEAGNLSKEKSEPTDFDHRRLLITSTQIQNTSTTGIIRVIRNPDTRPFVQGDGELLGKLGVIFEPYYALEARLVAVSGSRPGLTHVKEWSWQKWNKRYVVSLLQFLITEIRDSLKENNVGLDCDIAYIRIRSAGPQDISVLRFYAHHAIDTSQPPTERRSSAIQKRTKSMEWNCMKTGKLTLACWIMGSHTHLPVDCGEFNLYPVKGSPYQNRFSILAPFSIGLVNEQPDALLVLEGLVTHQDDLGILKGCLSRVSAPIFRIARQLACLGNDNSSRDLGQHVDGGAWKSGLEVFEAFKGSAELFATKVQLNPLDMNSGDKGSICFWYGLEILGKYQMINLVPDRNQDFVKILVANAWRKFVIEGRHNDKFISLIDCEVKGMDPHK